MKRFVTLAIMLVLPLLYLHAADIAPISNAFKSGNASSLLSIMDKEVDMATPGSSKKCTEKEAVDQLNAFFQANKPTGFNILHNADKNDSGFLVGKLQTGNGEFRVNITYRTEGGKTIIQSVRIE